MRCERCDQYTHDDDLFELMNGDEVCGTCADDLAIFAPSSETITEHNKETT